MPFTLWRAKGPSYEAGVFRVYGDSGWLLWRWVHRIEKGSVPHKEPQLELWTMRCLWRL